MANSNTMNYLDSLGLDGHLILEDGVTGKGYYAVTRDENGQIVRDQIGDVVKVWREWPNGFRMYKLIAAYAEDGHHYNKGAGFYRDGEA